ncbi:MAG: Mth938-like domain-containing protein [Paracoccus sp. (in: a-proteobacteria)]
MDLSEAEYPQGALPIDGYGPGLFRVGGMIRNGGVVVSVFGVMPWAGIADRDALLGLAGHVDVLFLGMGADISMPPRDLAEALDRLGLMVEPMSSPSAARSYNVLLAEGRRVACALLPV